MPRFYNHTPKNKTEFGIRLQNLLRKRGLSQTVVANMLGYSEPALHHWLYGLCEMRVSTFAILVDALQLTSKEIGYLLEPYWEEENDG